MTLNLFADLYNFSKLIHTASIIIIVVEAINAMKVWHGMTYDKNACGKKFNDSNDLNDKVNNKYCNNNSDNQNWREMESMRCIAWGRSRIRRAVCCYRFYGLLQPSGLKLIYLGLFNAAKFCKDDQGNRQLKRCPNATSPDASPLYLRNTSTTLSYSHNFFNDWP